MDEYLWEIKDGSASILIFWQLEFLQDTPVSKKETHTTAVQ